MRCRECRALLWSYVDRELSDAQRRAVGGHLARCDDCALAHERLRAFPLQPGQLAAVVPPPDFTARLMQRIEVLPTPVELARQAPRSAPFGNAAGALLAFSAAAAALFLGLLSTVVVALLDGRALPLFAFNQPGRGVTNAFAGRLADTLWSLVSWPVLLALVGMQLVLALLWFRLVVAPRRRSPFAPDDPGPAPRRRRAPPARR